MTESQITKLYKEAIGRPATQAEINQHIQNGTQLQELTKFLYSNPDARPEREAEITRIYKEYFGKSPEPWELSQQMNSQTSLDAIEKWASENKVDTTSSSTPKDTNTSTAENFYSSAGKTGTTTGTTGGQPKLVRFTGSPEVYDVSGGSLRHVTADEFSSKGYSWDSVQDTSSYSADLIKQADGKVFVSIDGTNIHVPDMTTFNKIGFSKNVFTDTGATATDLPDMTEYTSGEKLGSIWSKDPDVQALYDASGKGKVGTGAEGTTIQDWATQIGYKEYPDVLGDYSPTNMVRSAYQLMFGRDPFDATNPDPGAMDWVNAVTSGYITSWDDLTGKMSLDAGNEWASLSEAQKTANLLDWESTVQDIPEFAEFFPEAAELKAIQDEMDEFYNKEIERYKKEREIVEGRTIEDWATFTEDISEDKEMELTDAQLQFRQALKGATEAYGKAGLAFSSLRKGTEQETRAALKRKQDIIALQAERATGKLDTQKTRILEDLERAQAEYLRQTNITKKLNTEQIFASKEARALNRYMIGLDFASGVEGQANLYGQSAFTSSGQFANPTQYTPKANEVFGSIAPGANTTNNVSTSESALATTCPTGQKLINGVCVPTAGQWTPGSNTGGVISGADYDAYQSSKL